MSDSDVQTNSCEHRTLPCGRFLTDPTHSEYLPRRDRACVRGAMSSASISAAVVHTVMPASRAEFVQVEVDAGRVLLGRSPDRKSTRLNSSHLGISYAV